MCDVTPCVLTAALPPGCAAVSAPPVSGSPQWRFSSPQHGLEPQVWTWYLSHTSVVKREKTLAWSQAVWVMVHHLNPAGLLAPGTIQELLFHISESFCVGWEQWVFVLMQPMSLPTQTQQESSVQNVKMWCSSLTRVDFLSRSPVELFHTYSVKDMTFNPPVAPPATKKKVWKSNAHIVCQIRFTATELLIGFILFVHQDRFVILAKMMDGELQRQVERVLTGGREVELDFNATHTHTHSCLDQSEKNVKAKNWFNKQ